MQTFLPYPDFAESMKCLDDKRLGNQVYREGMTLLRGGWQNHPASKMWRGYQDALALYLWWGCRELNRRGKNYRGRPWWNELFDHDMPPVIVKPPWLGNEDFHAAHRSNLIRKDPEWYGQFGWSEPNDLPYIWPAH
jgi:hypothetical protein